MKIGCISRDSQSIADVTPSDLIQARTPALINAFIGVGNCLSNQIYETEITVLDVQGSILKKPSKKEDSS